ncbi:MAG: sensor histidine kinase [Betaproteobacteria bacterium]
MTSHHASLEGLVADCAVRFTAVPLPGDVEHQIEQALRALLELFQADRCALLGCAPGAGLSWVTCSACADSTVQPFDDLNFAAAFPWHFETACRRAKSVAVTSLADLPPEAEQDRRSAATLSVRSMLTVVVNGREGDAHCLVIQSLRSERSWPEPSLARLPALTQVFVNALSRKRIEEKRRLEIRHADLLESVGAILWRADARTLQTTFVSKEAETILGYPVESWLKVPGFWQDHLHPDDRAWVEAFVDKAVREHRNHDFEYRMVVADGRTIWLRDIVKVVVEGGRPAALYGVTVDITARKRAEFEAAQLRHQLIHAGRMTSLGELSATLAHELNQPLGAIVSNAEVARMVLDSVPPPVDRLRAILDDVERDGKRAGAIIHRIRMLLQKRAPDMRPVDVASLIDAVVGLARPLALSRHIDLTVELGPGSLWSCGDAVQIQQVLLNLMLNAIDAVSSQPPHARHAIAVRGASCGSTAEVSVSDSGRGIPADALAQVFDPFFTTKPSGMGMGLAICRTIVEAHGGRIEVRNNPSGGATALFALPTWNGEEPVP